MSEKEERVSFSPWLILLHLGLPHWIPSCSSPSLSWNRHPWKKDFSVAFKPVSRKATATWAGMLDYRVPCPPYGHLLLLVSGLTLVCHSVDVRMHRSVFSAEWSPEWQYRPLLGMKTLCSNGASWIFNCRYLCLWCVSLSWCLADHEVYSEMTLHQSKQINNCANSRHCRVSVLAGWVMISLVLAGLREPRICLGGIEHAVGKCQKCKEESQGKNRENKCEPEVASVRDTDTRSTQMWPNRKMNWDLGCQKTQQIEWGSLTPSGRLHYGVWAHSFAFQVFYPGEQQILVREDEESNKGQGGPHGILL